MSGEYQERLRLDEGVLDLRVGSIEREDERVPLTTRELELLRYLAARDGEPASREQLLIDVWEYAPGVESRTVDTTVKRLRRKLEVDPRKPHHLVSVHGVGYRLVAAAEPMVPAPERPAEAPVAPDPDRFFGRDAELAAIDAALQTHARLITLRGAGGVGRSRLAREVARARHDASDAVLWLGLEEARSDDDVRGELGSALGLPTSTDQESLLEALSARVPALVVLDEVDRARDALRRLLPPLTKGAPGATFLATAQQTLDLPFEVEVHVEPLPTPEAIALFVDRAEVDVAADPETLERLAEALDGLPLALELAAARTAVLGPAEILDRLDQRFRLLATRKGGRKQRLRDTIAWAWESLEDDEERDALVACSVFRGGFDLAAAEAVVGAVCPDAWVLDLIDALEARSLLQRRSAGARSRLFLMESVRTFAAQEGDPELLAAATGHHRDYMVGLGRRLLHETDGPNVKAAIAGLLAERANLRAAWASAPPGPVRAELACQGARLHERTGSARVGLEIIDATIADPGELPGALRAELALVRALLLRALNELDDARAEAEDVIERAEALRSDGREAEAWPLYGAATTLLSDLDTDTGSSADATAKLEWALEQLPPDPTPYRLQVLHRLGMVLFHVGRVDEAVAMGEQLFAEAKETGNLLAEGDARRLLGGLALRRSRFDEAWDRVDSARAIFADVGEPVREALSVEVMGVVRAFQGRHTEAAPFQARAVEIYRRMGRRHELPRALGNYARMLMHSGRQAEARVVAEDAMAVARARGALRQELEARTLTGSIALVDGRMADALASYRQAVEEARRAALPLLVATSNALIGITLLLQDELEEARTATVRAIGVYEEVGDKLGLSHHLATLAAVEACDGHLDEAERLLERAVAASPPATGHEAWLATCAGFLHAERLRAGVDVEGSTDGVQAGLQARQITAFGHLLADKLGRWVGRPDAS